jgi:hypothetical protein
LVRERKVSFLPRRKEDADEETNLHEHEEVTHEEQLMTRLQHLEERFVDQIGTQIGEPTKQVTENQIHITWKMTSLLLKSRDFNRRR